MMQDHYETLGLDPDASEPEIKAAYRTLVRSLHPDLRSGGEGGATDRLLEVQRAYEVLSHPGRRASYDAGLPEGMESMLAEGGGVAEALADVLTVVRREAVNGATRHAMAAPWERVEEPMRSRVDGGNRAAGAPEPAAASPGPDLPTPTGDRTFLTAVGASVALVALAGSLALVAVAGAVGLIDFLSFLLMALLAPVLALLGSWVLSYADGRLDAALRRGAQRLRTIRERRPAAAGPSTHGGGELLRPLVLLTAGGVYALVGAAPGAFILALLSGVAFALLHRVRLEGGPRRLLLACNLLVAFCALGLAGAAWHGSELAAAGALLAGGDTPAADLVRRITGLVGALLVVVVLYVVADAWHDLADLADRSDLAERWADDGSDVVADTGRRALALAAKPVAPIAGVLALALEGLATIVRTCSMPGTLIRRAVGGGWL